MLDLFQVLVKTEKAYESKSVWERHQVAYPLVSLSETCKLKPSGYEGYNLHIITNDASGKPVSFFVEVHKDSKTAAANNWLHWELVHFKAIRDYHGYALTNGETMEAAEYELKKSELAQVGVGIQTTRPDGTPRADLGVISITKYNESIPLENQKTAIKMYAVAKV